ncbi:Ribosomal RNA small subunit methyltransferase H [compost metagenome]
MQIACHTPLSAIGAGKKPDCERLSGPSVWRGSQTPTKGERTVKDAGFHHVSVLLEEVLDLLHPAPGGRFLDGTVGGAGHAAALLERVGPEGFLYGIDQDPAALAVAEERLSRLGSNFELRRGNFADVLPEWDLPPLTGILLDLGVSSHQLDTAERGFSFRHEGPLDMRMGDEGPSAADLVNGLPERELVDILFRYGEERQSRAIARAILKRRTDQPFRTTRELADVIERVIPAYKAGGIHPATRTFQALRIAVNRELDVLTQVLPAAISKLAPGGRLAVISFHSLEDRIVKTVFRDMAKTCVCPPKLPICVCGTVPQVKVITSKPVEASEDEVRANPRSRSAKLRVAERI